MDLENIAGGWINRTGGIDGVDYRPTGFAVENSGIIREGYRDTGFRVDDRGNIRGHYGAFTPFRINDFGVVERDLRG